MRDRAVIDLGSDCIKIMIGNKNRVKFCGVIRTPENSFLDERIVNGEALAEAIKIFINSKNAKVDSVDFVIRGQDIVTRIIEVPIMEEEGIRKTLDWETSQYLPLNGENYYIDYEILDKINDKTKKVYKLLVAAAGRTKIDSYADLVSMLGLKLHAIDISSNCITRLFKETVKKQSEVEGVGIINIGNEASSIIIMDKGKFFIEREVPFGMKNIFREVCRYEQVQSEEAEQLFFNSFDISLIDRKKELDVRIENQFNNVLASFDKIIQFYATGRTKKSLDEIFVIGEGSGIQGLEAFIHNYLSSNVKIVTNAKTVNLKTKVPGDCKFELFINALGLLLRKE